MGIDPEDAEQYVFKSIVLKEKKLEPDIVGFPVLESNKQKIFLEFQAYAYPFIKYNLLSKALMACAQDNDPGEVLAVIVYTEQKYKDAALSIHAFHALGKPADVLFDHQLKELVLTNYTLEQLLEIDPKLVVLAPFTVSTSIPSSTLTAHGRQWKKTICSVYEMADLNDAINVMSLFILNRFKAITREGIKAMLDFDILDTVAGKQVYDEGLEKGRQEGREEGHEKGLEKGLEKGRQEVLVDMREMFVLNLKKRFGDISADIMNALYAIKDSDILKTLFSESFSCDNYDHFQKKLATVNI